MPFDVATLPRREQVLLGALELLRTRGWCKDQSYSSGGSLCMLAALREAGKIRTNVEFKALGIPYGVSFNDAEGRTFAEVEQWFLDRIAEGFEGIQPRVSAA